MPRTQLNNLKRKNLSLNKETLRSLSPRELEGIHGASTPFIWTVIKVAGAIGDGSDFAELIEEWTDPVHCERKFTVGANAWCVEGKEDSFNLWAGPRSR